MLFRKIWRLSVGVGLGLGMLAGASFADPLSFRDARKALPRAKAKPVIAVDQRAVPQSDLAQLERGNQGIEDVLEALGAAIPSYGAVAISPDEGLFVEWLNGVGRFHDMASARNAALAYCNGKRKSSSRGCQVVVEVSPRGAKPGAALSLSSAANAALRGPYRKLKSPKAFAISPSTGNYGFDRGDGGRALAACKSAGAGAADCRIVVAD